MNRDEALAFLKMVHLSCQNLNPTSIYLDESKVTDAFVGYRIIIRGIMEKEYRDFIDSFAVQNNLLVMDDGEKLIIYRER